MGPLKVRYRLSLNILEYAVLIPADDLADVLAIVHVVVVAIVSALLAFFESVFIEDVDTRFLPLEVRSIHEPRQLEAPERRAFCGNAAEKVVPGRRHQ